MSDYLLPSKYDSLTIGNGEVGFGGENANNQQNRHGSSSDLSACTSPKNKQQVQKRKIGRNEDDGLDDLSTMM